MVVVIMDLTRSGLVRKDARLVGGVSLSNGSENIAISASFFSRSIDDGARRVSGLAVRRRGSRFFGEGRVALLTFVPDFFFLVLVLPWLAADIGTPRLRVSSREAL